MDIEQEFMHETFWGVPCLSGDDKRLTTLVLERGYLTYMQRSAEVWSTFPNTWRIFFKQRLRWARNTWRSDLRALSRPWVYRHPFLAYTMMDKGLSGFTLLLGPAFMVHSLINQNWIFAAVLAGWWQLSRSAKLLPHLRRRPSSFLFIPGYVFVSWIMAIIKLQALLTIRRQRWLTRQVAVENGQVVRTAGADPAESTGGTVGAPQGAPVPVGARAGAAVGHDADPAARSGRRAGRRSRSYPAAAAADRPGAGAAAGAADRAADTGPSPTSPVRGGPADVAGQRGRPAAGDRAAVRCPSRRTHAQRADGKPAVESQTQPHQAAVARKGVA